MRLARAHVTVPRIWTVELRHRPEGAALSCSRCMPRDQCAKSASARSVALAHLARHARADVLPEYLRTCQCGQRGCPWHPRHRGCAGPVRLALTREHSGRAWRLADTCAACAATTADTAVVPDTFLSPVRPSLSAPSPAAGGCSTPRLRRADDEQVRVREMLTYLASALPRFTSPSARLLALQCALRSDSCGHALLPPGLLRGMRLYGRGEWWEELSQAGWLRVSDPRRAPLEVRLFDAAVLDQVPGRRARLRAAHWALRPLPAHPAPVTPMALQLTTLVLAVHPVSGIEIDTLARLCGHSAHQTADLLDRLTARRMLASWCHDQRTGGVAWELTQGVPRKTEGSKCPGARAASGDTECTAFPPPEAGFRSAPSTGPEGGFSTVRAGD